MNAEKRRSSGRVVVIAGMTVNLALGILYSWSAFQSVLVHEQYGWTALQSQVPYMIACLVFALSMVPAGRIQDRIGPHKLIAIAGVLVCAGFVLSGLLITPAGLSVSFGIVFGLAMGLGYAAPTPAAVKWFAPAKRGLISGIVVSGFGLAGIYTAPLVRYLLSHYGLAETFVILGIAYGVLIMVLSRFVSNPPKGYVPAGMDGDPQKNKAGQKSSGLDWHQMLKTPAFYKLWALFCMGTFAGLFIIGQLRVIGEEQALLSESGTFLLIAVYSFFNWAGRIGCGLLSDRLGPRRVLFLVFAVQTAVFSAFGFLTSALPLFAGTALVGFTFGGMLTVFPAITADLFGVKNLGVNYGLVFTAWGAGGVFGPLVGGLVRDLTGVYGVSYAVSAVLSAAGIVLALTVKAPHRSGDRSVTD